MPVHSAEFVVIVCCMLAGEILIGLTLNLYIMTKWYKEVNKLNNKIKRHGNNFIIALKVIDLIICATVIPFAFAALIVDSASNFIVCFIKEGLVMLASSGSSFCVLLISVDRYFAVVLPTKHVLTTTRITVLRIAVAAVAVTGFFLPFLSLAMGLYESAQKEISDILPCRHVLWVFRPFYFYESYYVLIFIVAVITTCLCYRSVLNVVRRRLMVRTTTVTSTSTATGEAVNVGRFRKQEFKATRVAFLVVLSFLVLWVPHMVITVIQFAHPTNLVIDMIQAVCLAIAFLAPISHPIIYTYENREISNLSDRYCSIVLCVPWFKRRSRVSPNPTNVGSAEPSQNTSVCRNSVNTVDINLPKQAPEV